MWPTTLYNTHPKQRHKKNVGKTKTLFWSLKEKKLKGTNKVKPGRRLGKATHIMGFSSLGKKKANRWYMVTNPWVDCKENWHLMHWGRHHYPSWNKANKGGKKNNNNKKKQKKNRAMSICRVITAGLMVQRRVIPKITSLKYELNTDSVSQQPLRERLHKWRSLESRMQRVVDDARFPFSYCTLWAFESKLEKKKKTAESNRAHRKRKVRTG